MSYIKYDELGVVEVRCINCGKPVAIRSYQKVKIKCIPPRTENIMTMKKLSSWRQRKVILDDGSYMEVILCSECEDLDIKPEKIETEIGKAWESTLKQEGRQSNEIKNYVKRLPKIERGKDKIQAYKEKRVGR